MEYAVAEASIGGLTALYNALGAKLMLDLYLAFVATGNMVNLRRIARESDKHDYIHLHDVLRGL